MKRCIKCSGLMPDDATKCIRCGFESRSALQPAVNPYAPPKATLEKVDSVNTSGMGKGHPIPGGVKGWSWGAFLLNWIWSIGNRTWIGLLALVPYAGFIMAIVLGIKGREWAWRNKRWDSLDHFTRVQRRWSLWALILVGGSMLLGILAAIVIPLLSGPN